MKLDVYLKQKGISQARLARRLGMSRSAVCLLVSGKRFPSPETMRRVLLATEGEVKPNDFYDDTMQ